MLTPDSLKLEGSPAEIPFAVRDDLPSFCVQMGFKVGAEIGVAKGEFSEKFCKAGLKMYCIDSWKAYPDYEEPGIQERLDSEFLEATTRLHRYGATILRKTSMEALADIPDRSLDFVYIDGHHGFKYVAEDLWEWSKKVRKGGMISGHDYFVPRRPYREAAYVLHTKFVVDAFTKAMKIDKWYVLGSKIRKEGENRDRFRSFMWLNQ